MKKIIKVIKPAYYNNRVIAPGTIIRDYERDKMPSWAVPLNEEKENKNANTDNASLSEKKEKEPDKKPAGPAGDDKEQIDELETLKTEAIEKNIVIEDTDKKSVTEQIAELKTLLNKE